MITATDFNIITISTIREIIPHISESSLLVLDIDDTIMTATTYIGSGQWEKDLVKQFIKEGFSPEEAFHKAETIWRKAQKNTRMRLIDQDVLSIFSNNYNCIGCTARSTRLIDITIDQLKDVGISFAKEKASFPIPGCSKAYYHQGIIFCEGFSKGTSLFAFLKTISFPSKIIMIDDSLSHLEDVSLAAQKYGVAFVGLLYNSGV